MATEKKIVETSEEDGREIAADTDVKIVVGKAALMLCSLKL